MISLRVLGGLVVEGSESALTGRAAQRKRLALLALLAAAPLRKLSRDKIMACLWPEAGTSQARHLVSVSVYELRKALGEAAIHATGDDLELNPGAVRVDLVEFEQAVRSGDFEAAAALYRGSFLDGFFLTDSAEFEGWSDAERRRLERSFSVVLTALAEQRESEGAFAAAAQAWRRLMTHEPTNSACVLGLMQAMAKSGDRVGAVAAAREHAALLARDYGAEPDARVVAYADQLAQDTAFTGRDLGAALTPSRWSSRGVGDRAGARFRSPSAKAGFATAGIVILVLVGAVTLRPRAAHPGRVAVVPFENRTGDPDVGSVGEMAADWITESLVRASVLAVVDVQAIIRRSAAGKPDVARLNAGTLVTGSYYRQGDRLVFHVRITSAHGELIEALPPIASSWAEPTRGMDELRDRVVAALAQHFDVSVASFEGKGSSAPSYQSYQAYVEALHAYLNGDFSAATKQFQRAAVLDTTFLRALLWAAASARMAGDEAYAVQAWQRLRARMADLSRYDYHHAAFFDAAAHLDLERAYTEALAMMNASPGSEDAVREAALSALRTWRINRALALFQRLDTESGLIREWPAYYVRVAMAYEHLGQLDRAYEVALAGRASMTDAHTLGAVGAVAASRGNLTVALAMADTILEWFPESSSTSQIAARLAARGYVTEANQLWQRAAEQSRDPVIRALRYYYARRYTDASAVIDSIQHAGEVNEQVLGLRGLMSALRGDTTRARALLDSVKALPNARLAKHWLARLYAVLGQRDAAVRELGHVLYEPWLDELPSRLDPGLRSLHGYPPFERAMRPRD